MFCLRMPLGLVDDLRRQLVHGAAPIDLALGLVIDGANVEFVTPARTRAPTHGEPRLRVGFFPQHLRGATHAYWHAFPIGRPAQPMVDLALFEAPGCSAAVLHDGRAFPLEAVQLVGAGMPRWLPGAVAPAAEPMLAGDGLFSRYLEPIGGRDAHARLRALRIGIVGCSRLGSLLVTALGKIGVREVVLVDADVVEDHHLDAMDVPGPQCVGMHKVDAVAALQAELAPDLRVHAIAHDVEHRDAIAALRTCDVIVTAPDRGQPRLLASLCASAYGRVHLDIGSGVLRRDEGRSADLDFGADIRLILPGHCLLCVGGVDLDTRHVADWRRQRAGSLRSLNGMATSYALFLLERLITGDLGATTWTRLRLDARAQLRTEQPAFSARPQCPVCSESGRGDAVWRQAATLTTR